MTIPVAMGTIATQLLLRRIRDPGRIPRAMEIPVDLSGCIRGWKHDLEFPRQFSHVGAVLVVGLVPQVGCDLAFNRAAADGNIIYAAVCRRRVMPSRDAVKLDLVTPSISSRLNGMQIDAPSVRVTEGQRGGQPVSFH